MEDNTDTNNYKTVKKKNTKSLQQATDKTTTNNNNNNDIENSSTDNKNTMTNNAFSHEERGTEHEHDNHHDDHDETKQEEKVASIEDGECLIVIHSDEEKSSEYQQQYQHRPQEEQQHQHHHHHGSNDNNPVSSSVTTNSNMDESIGSHLPMNQNRATIPPYEAEERTVVDLSSYSTQTDATNPNFHEQKQLLLAAASLLLNNNDDHHDEPHPHRHHHHDIGDGEGRVGHPSPQPTYNMDTPNQSSTVPSTPTPYHPYHPSHTYSTSNNINNVNSAGAVISPNNRFPVHHHGAQQHSGMQTFQSGSASSYYYPRAGSDVNGTASSGSNYWWPSSWRDWQYPTTAPPPTTATAAVAEVPTTVHNGETEVGGGSDRKVTAKPITPKATPNKHIPDDSDLLPLPSSSSSSSSSKVARRMIEAADILPTESDILCGQSRSYAKHSGNVQFQHLLDDYVPTYSDTSVGKQERIKLTKEIVHRIGLLGWRFLKLKENGFWEEIPTIKARDKVGHALRTKVASLKRKRMRNSLKGMKKQRGRRRSSASSTSSNSNNGNSNNETSEQGKGNGTEGQGQGKTEH